MQQALSASNIKYLLALRSLCGPSNEIRCVSVADALGISKASVHAMMNALKEKNLIEKNHYGMVHFTPGGPQPGGSVRRLLRRSGGLSAPCLL